MNLNINRNTILLTVAMILLQVAAYGENLETGKIKEDILEIQGGGTWLEDEYLSGYRYSGFTVGIRNSWIQQFRKEKAKNWQSKTSLQFDFGRALNSSKRNLIYSYEVGGLWGAYYDFEEMIGISGLELKLGPNIGINFGVREHSGNVNKPYSFNLNGEIGVGGRIGYKWICKRSSWKIRYDIEAAGIGLGFASDYWESYYELSEIGIKGSNIYFSQPFNRQHLEQSIMLDIDLKRSSWLIGLRHNWDWQKINNLTMSQEKICLVIGTKFIYSLYRRVYLK